ncbi:hypothetical protein CFter6_4993 [Collimonas fungivorans]|uniref:Uncharacterized protein n=1 Tax=Collimonas fungivorans TaxID=158899 RepID=A0A127PIJ6_9BURK|nr:hypothetical protein CFter6_4993 [Collimonas fungivorans]
MRHFTPAHPQDRGFREFAKLTWSTVFMSIEINRREQREIAMQLIFSCNFGGRTG